MVRKWSVAMAADSGFGGEPERCPECSASLDDCECPRCPTCGGFLTDCEHDEGDFDCQFARAAAWSRRANAEASALSESIDRFVEAVDRTCDDVGAIVALIA